ncbi:MAG: ATP-binding protein, partial [Bacilli bacterium]|nr:ATP-binding protein [Bacilli bacterium]
MSPFLFVNTTSATCCFLFLIFLFISYFTRSNMNNIENKIYKRLLLCNALCVISYICFYVSDIICYLNNNDPTLYNIMFFFSKISPIFLISWGGYFIFYAIVVTNELNEKLRTKILKNERLCFIITDIYIVVVTILHLIQHTVVDTSTAVESTILIAMNISSYFGLLSVIVMVLVNRKKTSKKKILPLLMIIPIVLFAIILMLFPLVFVYIIITLIDHLMFHTIENPDVKMINELTLAKTQAEQASNAKSDFLSSMSHELRTPLNAIVGLSQMIVTESDKQEVRDDANDILKASNNLLELVDGILDINKLETNNMEIVNRDYNPIEVFDDLVRMINVRIGDKPIELRYRFASNLPSTLNGDKDKVKRIISNLLTNAVKYTEEGFVEFNVDCMTKDDNCNLRITVSDSGRGISEEQMDKLFTKFYRREEDK